MKALVQDGQVVAVYRKPRSITIDGIVHPATILTAWSAEELAAIGIVDYEEITPDQRYYEFSECVDTFSDNKVTRTYAPVERDLYDTVIVVDGEDETINGLLSNAVNSVKATAGSLLSTTDWMITRESERNIPVPLNVRAYRQAIADKSEGAEAAILACDTLDKFIALPVVEWPKETDDYSAYVPQVVSMRQARLALHAAGLLGSVNAAVTLDPVNELEWNYATVVDRNSSLVTGIGVGLGLTDVQIDDLFRSAATL